MNEERDQRPELEQDNKNIYCAVLSHIISTIQVSMHNNFTRIKMSRCLL